MSMVIMKWYKIELRIVVQALTITPAIKRPANMYGHQGIERKMSVIGGTALYLSSLAYCPVIIELKWPMQIPISALATLNATQ